MTSNHSFDRFVGLFSLDFLGAIGSLQGLDSLLNKLFLSHYAEICVSDQVTSRPPLLSNGFSECFTCSLDYSLFVNSFKVSFSDLSRVAVSNGALDKAT